jgi:hypothetical protein
LRDIMSWRRDDRVKIPGSPIGQSIIVSMTCSAVFGRGQSGAQERTRTFTAVKPLAPEASASTNSTTWAQGGLVRTGFAIVNLADCRPNPLYSTDMMAYRESAKYHHEHSNLTGRN